MQRDNIDQMYGRSYMSNTGNNLRDLMLQAVGDYVTPEEEQAYLL